MEPPVIALRFRDIDAIETIDAHQSIIQAHGSSWWGWWKKYVENGDAGEPSRFPHAFNVMLVDRSAKRAFIAHCAGVKRSLDPSELHLVPDYYREYANEVYQWFKLDQIQEIGDYPILIDLQFSQTPESTIIDLGSASSMPVGSTSRHKMKGDTVLHLSDLHFGSDYSFLPPGQPPRVGDSSRTLTDALMSDLERLRKVEEIGLVLVTGDFTSIGDWSDKTRDAILQELGQLVTRLGLEMERIVAVPGNHDVVRYPAGENVDVPSVVLAQTNQKHERDFRMFSELLCGRSWRLPMNRTQGFVTPGGVHVDIAALNSCSIAATKWTEYGYVGDNGYDVLKQLGQAEVTHLTYRVMALHHHVLPVSPIMEPEEKGVSMTLDAAKLLDLAASAKIGIVVHGHQHYARFSRYESIARMGGPQCQRMAVVAGGSTGVKSSRRGNERNTYSLLRLRDGGSHLHVRELRSDGEAGATIFDLPLGVKPIQPPGAKRLRGRR